MLASELALESADVALPSRVPARTLVGSRYVDAISWPGRLKGFEQDAFVDGELSDSQSLQRNISSGAMANAV